VSRGDAAVDLETLCQRRDALKEMTDAEIARAVELVDKMSLAVSAAPASELMEKHKMLEWKKAEVNEMRVLQAKALETIQADIDKLEKLQSPDHSSDQAQSDTSLSPAYKTPSLNLRHLSSGSVVHSGMA